MSRTVNDGLIKGLTIGLEGVLVSHLQFADDTIFILEQDVDSFVNTLSILRLFEVISGLKIYLTKRY